MADESGRTLPRLHEMLEAMIDVAPLEGPELSLSVSEVTFDLPLEIDATMFGGSVAALGASPPTQIVETTVMPVFHQLRVTFAAGARW